MSARYIEGKSCLHCDGLIESRGPKRDAAAMFCSIACRGAHQKAQSVAAGKIISTNCETCGTPITFYASMRPKGAYCSISCKSIAHSARITGRIQDEFHRNSTFRKSMRRFLHDRCAICGWAEAPCDVAHVVGRGSGGANILENVTMLCPNHHRMFDCGLISVEEVRATRANVLKHQPSPP